MSFFDYEEALTYFKNSKLNDFNEKDLEKKLIAFVNTGNFTKALNVADQLLLNDKNNQEAWLVYLIYAKFQNKRINYFHKLSKLAYHY